MLLDDDVSFSGTSRDFQEPFQGQVSDRRRGGASEHSPPLQRGHQTCICQINDIVDVECQSAIERTRFRVEPACAQKSLQRKVQPLST